MMFNISRKNPAAFVIPFWSDGENHRLEYLKQTLHSIFNQTDPDWRIYITDDKSEAECDRLFLKELERKNSGKITVIFSEENMGPAQARNLAITQAYADNCSFICFLDSDDLASRFRVEKVRECFFNDPELSVVYSQISVINDEGYPVNKNNLIGGIKKIIDDIDRSPLEGYDIWLPIAMERDNLTIPSAMNVKTELAVKYPFPAFARFHEDTHTWLRYSASGAKVKFSAEIPSLYRVPKESCGSESRNRAGGRIIFNKLRAETIMKGLEEAIELGLRRNVITPDQVDVIKVRYLLNVASMIKDEGTISVANDLILQTQQLSREIYSQYKDTYNLEGLTFVSHELERTVSEDL
jgi:hypothetical protein